MTGPNGIKRNTNNSISMMHRICLVNRVYPHPTLRSSIGYGSTSSKRIPLKASVIKLVLYAMAPVVVVRLKSTVLPMPPHLILQTFEYLWPFVPWKTSTSLDLMCPMLLLRHPVVANSTTCALTHNFVRGGKPKDVVIFHLAMLYLSIRIFKAIRKRLVSSISILTKFYVIMTSNQRHMLLAYIVALLMVMTFFSFARLMILPSVLQAKPSMTRFVINLTPIFLNP
mmetsp:Transcript_51775/g.77272  ORF Transcript_51775/g.77272 Transcript_51775/m.77272 type:complete len:226 (+) Transcript_51775:216-893(+)